MMISASLCAVLDLLMSDNKLLEGILSVKAPNGPHHLSDGRIEQFLVRRAFFTATLGCDLLQQRSPETILESSQQPLDGVLHFHRSDHFPGWGGAKEGAGAGCDWGEGSVMVKVHGYAGTDAVGTRKKGHRQLKNIGPLIAKAFDVPMLCGSIGRARTWKGKKCIAIPLAMSLSRGGMVICG